MRMTVDLQVSSGHWQSFRFKQKVNFVSDQAALPGPGTTLPITDPLLPQFRSVY